ncbi:MAG TPA: head GIN domain-containing protein [Usitatibacter sp.]|jgi:hypothetical protein|nr:head GIN domain-containing protein [Usitatibacter sp.]
MTLAARLALPLFLALVPFAPPAAAATQAREHSGFSAISLSAPVEVELILGDRESVVLEGDEQVLAVIETAVEQGALHIRRKPGTSGWNSLAPVRARVTARQIRALSVAGSGDIKAAQVSADSLAIAISGSGDVTIGGGKAQSLTVSIAGSGNVKAAKLDAQSVSVRISGSGDALVWARQSLAVKVAGSGDVTYYGDPAVAQSIAGSGSVRRLGASPA